MAEYKPEVAALYADSAGAYIDVDGVDPWDEARDARGYKGPLPVVAHPPCNSWCMPLSKANRTRYGNAIGADGGTFAHALWAVRTFGGVLEHPANSSAFEFFGVPKPSRGKWSHVGQTWRWDTEESKGPGQRGQWVCQVSQSAYGHQAIKRTWLLYVGFTPPQELRWDEPPATAVTSWLQRTNTTLPRISKRKAMQTPHEFRDEMLRLARHSQVRS